MQTPEARCARLFAYAELSCTACTRFISMCMRTTFHVHQQLKLRAVRKLVSSETGIWEKRFFLMFAVLHLESGEISAAMVGAGGLLSSLKKTPHF